MGATRIAVGCCVALTVVGSLWARPAPATQRDSQPLFRIERSKNANVVQYDAQLTSAGRLDPKRPVSVYWIRLATDGQRKDLSWVQRRFAYGFDARYDRERDAAVLEMVAPVGRTLRVYRAEEDGRYRAETEIDGRKAFIERLYIHSIEGGWRPKVGYIDFFGVDVETGESRYERFLPE